MKNKRLRGDYIGNYAPYGYLKDENNRSRLVIDHEIAPIVVEIFELRAKGIGFDTICRILNEKGYPSPGRLRYERGIITNNNKKGSELPWNRHVLKDLLVNVVYIGNLAQGRSSQCLYKGENTIGQKRRTGMWLKGHMSRLSAWSCGIRCRRSTKRSQAMRRNPSDAMRICPSVPIHTVRF